MSYHWFKKKGKKYIYCKDRICKPKIRCNMLESEKITCITFVKYLGQVITDRCV